MRNEFYTWKEGESNRLDDSLEHQTYNESNGARAVLVLDVMRSFPEPVFTWNRILRKLSEWFYGPKLVRKADKFRLQKPLWPSCSARCGT